MDALVQHSTPSLIDRNDRPDLIRTITLRGCYSRLTPCPPFGGNLKVPRDAVVITSKVGYFRGTAAHGYQPLHMRHQLEQTLHNLGTDHLDIYFFHHPDFGGNDTYLDAAIDTMRRFRDQGLIRAIGMRGPHRHALDRLTGATTGNKYQRFVQLFNNIDPDVLAVRDNLLTPQSRAGIFQLADHHNCGVLITKPLAQGLLTGSHHPTRPRQFGPGDHRSRKRWFTPTAVTIITDGLDQLRRLAGPDPADLIRIALWSCLQRSDNAAVLVGFTRAEQITTNMTCLGDPPPAHTIDTARRITADVQQRLDATGQVFTDEPQPKDAHHG